MWGLITMGNFMNNTQRMNVWSTLNKIDPLTWEIAEFRTDYPLNKIYKKLSFLTSTYYFIVRKTCIVFIHCSIFCILIVVHKLFTGKRINKILFIIVFSSGWIFLHSIPAALTVYPEFRYTIANFLVIFASIIISLSYVDLVNILKNDPEGTILINSRKGINCLGH